MYDREQIYTWLWNHSDSRGVVIYPIEKVSEMLEIERKMMQNIFREFVGTGHLRRHGTGAGLRHECTYHPSVCDWGDNYYTATMSLFKHRESRKSTARSKQAAKREGK